MGADLTRTDMPADTQSATGEPVAAGEAAKRRIWLCADDYGISASVNTAIRDLVVRGRINATSVMVVAPAFHRSEALSLAILNSGSARVAIGLHVTLTAPFKPLSPGYGPVREGAFLPLASTFRAAFLRQLKPEKIAVEVAMQIKAFATVFGKPPDFVDGHQHVHLFPQVRDAMLAAVRQNAPNAWLRQCGRLMPLRARFADRKGLLLDYLSRGFRRRVPPAEARDQSGFRGNLRFRGRCRFSRIVSCFSGAIAGRQRGDVSSRLRRRGAEAARSADIVTRA